jgi:hypothetical protein
MEDVSVEFSFLFARNLVCFRAKHLNFGDGGVVSGLVGSVHEMLELAEGLGRAAGVGKNILRVHGRGTEVDETG